MGSKGINGVVLGSHNTFSYLPIKQWWLKPFGFIAKCQSKNITRQLFHVNCIDVRVCLISDTWHFAHGAITYKGEVFKTLTDIFKHHNPIRPLYVRLILEKIIEDKDREFVQFKYLCKTFRSFYPNVIFFGGNYKKDWTQIYNFNTITDNDVVQFISSMRDDARWYEKLCPWLYANRNKDAIRKSYVPNKINLIDFI